MRLSLISNALKCFSESFAGKNEKLEDSDFLFGPNKEYEVLVANDLAKRLSAYHFVFNSYNKPELDYCTIGEPELWYSIYDASPKTITIIIKNNITNHIVASLTVIIKTQLGLPCLDEYPEEVNAIINDDKHLAEIVSLCIDKSVVCRHDIIIHLFKYAYLIARGIGSATNLMIMIKPSHATFYERKLLFNKVGGIKNCKKINDKPVALFNLDLAIAEEESMYSRINGIKDRNIFYYFKTAFESQELINNIKSTIKSLSFDDLFTLFIATNKFDNTDLDKIKTLPDLYTDPQIVKFLKNRVDSIRRIPEVLI